MSLSIRATAIGGLASVLLASTALAGPSQPFPTYTVGPQNDGSIVVSTTQIITPAGTQVALGSPVRAKAVAVNPNTATHTAAVLTMGSSAVQVFDTVSGQVVQTYSPAGNGAGSFTGLTYSADGKYLYISQDFSNLPTGDSDLAVAAVDASTGQLSDIALVDLPATTAIPLYSPGIAYPGGIAVTSDDKTALVTLNQNNTLGVVDLTQSPAVLTKQIATGNVPDQVAIVGQFAYVTNEGGRKALPGDFTDISSGTPIVANPATDSAKTGTVSVIYLPTGKLVQSISVGLHPTGIAVSGRFLYVVDAYSETISEIDTKTNTLRRTIPVTIPVQYAYGDNPCSIVVVGSTAYVTLYTANAVAAVDLTPGNKSPVLGFIPTGYGPSTIAYDSAHNQLVVSNDKGTGTQGSTASIYGVTGYNSHQDTGTVSLIPVPTPSQLATYTTQVVQNNHWDLAVNTEIGPKYVNRHAAPVAIPEHLGEPSLIKHVFLIIKENRTYDQVFGDLPGGNGDASLAVFGPYWPNQRALLSQFAFLDNVYAPSRQSADGHPWIVSGISAYADDIQSPYWIRSYPGGNSNDEMVYTPRGFLWDQATKQGLNVKLYGEWSLNHIISGSYTWTDWYNYSQYLEGVTPTNTSPITSPNVDTETSNVPSVARLLDPHFPSFDTGIPDQYRVDYWLPIFQNQEATNSLPALSVLWVMCDHTSGGSAGYPEPQAAEADNDLAVGRIVEAITHSNDWPSSAIFIEEDDAQNGVDHIDGHRQPVEVISPYAVQSNGTADHTAYTEANINRTIEQILGITPMTQFDLVASPMRTVFTNTANLRLFTHLPPTIALNTLNGAPAKHAENTLKGAWTLASTAAFKTHHDKADSLDEDFLNHAIWYAATDYKRPYPGESVMKMPSAFHMLPNPKKDIDD